MPTDTPTVRETSSVPDKPRTYRAPDDVYDAASDQAWQRREKEGLGKPIRLALRAYAKDPDAFEEACQRIIEGEKP